jgi:hypothetical protein
MLFKKKQTLPKEEKEIKLCKMEFVKDEAGQELLLKDDEFQVMMEWEKPYMKACIDALQPSGDVLEVGFGCGYSATFIQEYEPRSHTIIEYHPVVAAKAREWAKSYQNVTIIEDTWQNAIHQLGVFDTIFFDDYPLQSGKDTRHLEQVGDKASLILEKGQKLLNKIQEKFSFLKTIQYRDEDVDYFFKHLKDKESIDKAHFLPFFYDLKAKGHITEDQFKNVVNRLEKESLITAEVQEAFFEKMAKLGVKKDSFDFDERGDRFFEFLQLCLKEHMRKDSKFSCYLDRPTSKYEDEKFFNHIITNPSLDFKEHVIEVDVPKNCKYYFYNQALVIVIVKCV